MACVPLCCEVACASEVWVPGSTDRVVRWEPRKEPRVEACLKRSNKLLQG